MNVARTYGPEIGPKNLPVAEAEYRKQIDGATPEQVAAINQAASPTLNAIAQSRAQSVDAALKAKGPAAAAAERRAQTEAAPLEIAARVLEQRLAIDPITSYLEAQGNGYFYRPDTPSEDRYPEEFRKVHKMYEDLSAATNAASGTVRGDRMTQQIANDVVDAIPKGKLSLLNTSINKAVVNGSGVELSVAVVRELNSAGRVREAEGVTQRISDGLERLQVRFDRAAENYAKVNQEKFYLQLNYGYLADSSDPAQRQKLEKFWQHYDEKHPEIAKAQAELDRLTIQVMEATTAVDAGKGAFGGLRQEKSVNEAQKKLLNDPDLMNAISLSPAAQKALAEQTTQQRVSAAEAKASFNDQSYSGFKSRNFLEVLRDPGSQGRNASVCGGIIMTKYFMNEATRALTAEVPDPNAAKVAIDKLRVYEDVLGDSGARKANFDKMLSSFKDMIDAGRDVDAAKAALEKFKAARGDAANGPTYDPSSKAGAAIRLLGTAFAFGVFRRDIDKLNSGSAELKDHARTLADGISFAQQTLLVAAGIAKAKGWQIGAPAVATLDKLGDQVRYAGAAVDLIFALDEYSRADGDKVQGTLYAISAAGNVALATGYSVGSGATLFGLSGAAWTGIGTVILATAFVGTLGWQAYRHSQEASKFETPLTEDFLKTLGVKSEITREFRNQDGDGNSPGPVVAKLAEARGLDLQKPEHVKVLVNYLDSLNQDQMRELVSATHSVDPSEKGDYQVDRTPGENLLSLPADPTKLLHNPRTGQRVDPATGKATTIRYDAESRLWFDPVTKMQWNNDLKVWQSEGIKWPDDQDSQFYTYDPATSTLTRYVTEVDERQPAENEDGSSNDRNRIRHDRYFSEIRPDSVGDLDAWMQQRGLPVLWAPL